MRTSLYNQDLLDAAEHHEEGPEQIDWVVESPSGVLGETEGSWLDGSVDSNVTSEHDGFEVVLAALEEMSLKSDVSHLTKLGVEIKVSLMDDGAVLLLDDHGGAPGLKLIN